MARARALDADTKGPLKDIHRRVGTTIFFESSGGQRERIAHLPELRFALGGPSVDTTSIDSAALNLEATAFFIRRVSNDGFRIHYQPTLKKVVNDRKASLDFEKDVRPLMQKVVREHFEKDIPIRIESEWGYLSRNVPARPSASAGGHPSRNPTMPCGR